MVEIGYKLHYSTVFIFINIFHFLSNSAFLLATTSIIEENPHVIDTNDLQTYIVHVEPCPHDYYSQMLTVEEAQEKWYKSFLPVHSGELRLIYSYHHASTGFAARLTKDEFAEVEKKPGFLHADLDQVVKLHTTHTPQFLGLDPPTITSLWTNSSFGKGLIIGVLDSGIDQFHPSFQPNGEIPYPPPTKWKGKCEFTGMDTCNNKLLGAKFFDKGLTVAQGKNTSSLRGGSPADENGHGTHVAGIATGMFVSNANVETQANGIAAGTAPYAYLSVYRVCNINGDCTDSDILAGMDAAIGDGVDVINLSLGMPSRGKYYKSAIAKGAYRAIKKGIFVSAAAGNSGSNPSTIENDAPWLLTVGASTMDRKIQTTVALGNAQQQQFDGENVHQPRGYKSPFLPLVYPKSVYPPAAYCNSSLFKTCYIKVSGAIVVCEVGGRIGNIQKGRMVRKAGGAGMILVNPPDCDTTTAAEVHVLPTSHVGYEDGWEITTYIRDSTSQASIIFKNTVIGNSIVAPVMACFSSRGPSVSDPNILKPDIIGPGVNVLSASPFNIGKPSSKFIFMSGTSMATPHLSGIATLLKATHPDWSPAAIKSAIMTTAYTTANNGKSIMDDDMQNPADYYAMGAGHVDPTAANNPGLIYDLTPEDYIPYLCGLKYKNSQVSAITDTTIKCSRYKPKSGTELNYPSFAVTLKGKNPVTVTRTVTNVGPTDSTYKVQITQPPQGATVTVNPTELIFSTAKNTASYSVTFARPGGAPEQEKTYEAQLAWVSGSTKVVSPIVIKVCSTTSCSIQSM